MSINATRAIASNGATISSTAQDLEDIGFSTSEIDAADYVFITVATASLHFRYDGTAPTTSVGHLLDAGDMWVMSNNENIRNLQFIAVSGDGYVFITLEGY